MHCCDTWKAACPNWMRLEAQRRISNSYVAVDSPLGDRAIRICGTLMNRKTGTAPRVE